ncbi:hypothetical protein BGX29_000467 [Mortierella sp. GBA35]|nr:hypothetical protein BGX29_000467 [Mortierella sp. GBA35]
MSKQSLKVLAALFEFDIFERSAVLKPYGIYEELQEVSKAILTMDIYNESLGLLGKMIDDEEYRNKIHYGKELASILQTEEYAQIEFKDGQIQRGDILIGADGAYSVVRQSLYAQLEKEQQLLHTDTQSLEIGYTYMVGTTGPLDPETYPILKNKRSHFAVIIADEKPHSVEKRFLHTLA